MCRTADISDHKRIKDCGGNMGHHRRGNQRHGAGWRNNKLGGALSLKRPMTPFAVLACLSIFAMSSQIRVLFSSVLSPADIYHDVSPLAGSDDGWKPQETSAWRSLLQNPTDNISTTAGFINNTITKTDTGFPKPLYDLSDPDSFALFWNASHYYSRGLSRKPIGEGALLTQKQNNPPRMLVGIFTGIDMRERRQVIRDTSLNYQKEVEGMRRRRSEFYRACSLHELQTNQTQAKDCLLIYVFVAAGGSPGSSTLLLEPNVTTPMVVEGPPEHQDETDMIFLNIRENMNEGKTPTWFKYASSTLAEEHGLEFDYIAKMDDDTLLFTGNWIDILERRLPLPHKAHPQSLVYGGKVNHVHHAWAGRCQEVTSANIFSDCPLIGPLWMIGAFYFMSRELALYTTSAAIDHAALQSDEDVATATYVFSHPTLPKIFEIEPSSALVTYDLGWDWSFHRDHSRFQGVVFAHSENACFMPYGPYYKRLSNVRKVWKEYVLFRWKIRREFTNRYQLDDHPSLDRVFNSKMQKKKTRKHARQAVKVNYLDYIYSNDDFDASPIVLESPHNLVFFPVTGAGDVTWRCLIRRLLGYQDWDDPSHQFDGLTYLSDYTLEDASKIMSSREYTRAMFVRNPLDRIQSIYLQLVQDDPNMIRGCDCSRGCGDGDLLERCHSYTATFRDFVTDLVPSCDRPYWRPQAYRMEPKFFHTLDFVGHYEQFGLEAEHLLRRLATASDNQMDWMNAEELQNSLAGFDKSYQKQDYEDRFEAAWVGAFLYEYKSDDKFPLLSNYTLKLNREKAKAYRKKRKKLKWFGDTLEKTIA